MRFGAERNEFVLDSGKRIYAHAHLLSVKEGDPSLFYGYDGYVEHGLESIENRFTPEERQEIAEYMIERWRQWAALVMKAPG